MSELKGAEYIRFESIKHLRDDGSEYWSARELASALEYTKWENFHKVIKRAMIACENAGHSVLDDFPEVRKIVEAGVTSKPKNDIAGDLWFVGISSSGINYWQRRLMMLV